jgi:hypothetical protein
MKGVWIPKAGRHEARSRNNLFPSRFAVPGPSASTKRGNVTRPQCQIKLRFWRRISPETENNLGGTWIDHFLAILYAIWPHVRLQIQSPERWYLFSSLPTAWCARNKRRTLYGLNSEALDRTSSLAGSLDRHQFIVFGYIQPKDTLNDVTVSGATKLVSGLTREGSVSSSQSWWRGGIRFCSSNTERGAIILFILLYGKQFIRRWTLRPEAANTPETAWWLNLSTANQCGLTLLATS